MLFIYAMKVKWYQNMTQYVDKKKKKSKEIQTKTLNKNTKQQKQNTKQN